MAINEWIECKIADACSSIDYGYTAAASSEPFGPHFLRITDIVNEQINWSSVPHVSVDEMILKKFRLEERDIVIARTGASTGVSAYIQHPPDAIFASYLVRLKIKPEFDARFIAYFLRSENFWSYIRGVLGDKSAQPNASANTMTQATLRAPRSLHEQRAIAHILGQLDDKIDLNRRMNETLEAMAQAIFKDWFVDFAPVRAKAEGRSPYLASELWSLFPDMLIGDKPTGWDVGLIQDLFVLQRGFDLPTSQRIPGEYQVIAASGVNGTHNEYMVKGSGVTTGRSGVLGNVFFVHENFWPLNTSLWVKDFRRATPAFAYFFLKRMDISIFNAGSAVPTLNRNHIHNLPALLPPSTLIERFDEIAMLLLRRKRQNELETETLIQLRDLLLPKLISGEIRLKDAERTIEDAL